MRLHRVCIAWNRFRVCFMFVLSHFCALHLVFIASGRASRTPFAAIGDYHSGRRHDSAPSAPPGAPPGNGAQRPLRAARRAEPRPRWAGPHVPASNRKARFRCFSPPPANQRPQGDSNGERRARPRSGRERAAAAAVAEVSAGGRGAAVGGPAAP